MNSERKEIKHNFLRRIILRLDYSGVVEVKSWIEKLHERFSQFGFSTMREEFLRKPEFELYDPAPTKNQKYVPEPELESTPTYKYVTALEDMVLEINKHFTTLTIQPRLYREFEEYRDIFTYVITQIKNNNVFMSVQRLGLRKINDCIILEKSNLNSIFSEDVFIDVSQKLLNRDINSQLVNSNLLDTISIGDYYYNYNRSCTEGIIKKDGEEQLAYQAVLDIDGYIQDNDLLKEMINSEDLIEQTLDNVNDCLFQLYLASLNESFITHLKEEEFVIKYVLGVQKNA